MEEEIVQILYKAFASTNNEGPREAKEVLDSYTTNPNFFAALFNIIRNQQLPYSIRQSGISELKRQIVTNWQEVFSPEFKKVILDNFPLLILNIEPLYRKNMVALTNALVALSFEGYFWNFWVKLIKDFLTKDESHVFACSMILRSSLMCIYKTYQNVFHESEAYRNSQFMPFLHSIFSQITTIFVSAELELKTCLLKVVHRAILIDKNLFRDPTPPHNLTPTFMPYVESVAFITQNLANIPLNSLFLSFLVRLISIFTYTVNCMEAIPRSDELILLSSNLLFAQWENGANKQKLITTFFLLLSRHSGKPFWKANLLPKLPEMIQNVFIPFFSLDQEAVYQAYNDPTAFITDYHVDDVGQNDFPICSAFCALREICKENIVELQPLLFQILTDSYQNFLTTNNSASLYSAFHLCSSYFSIIYTYYFEQTAQFLQSIFPALQSSDPLVQSSILLLLSQTNPYNDKEEKSSSDNRISTNPNYIQIAISLLDSNHPLVKYFAIFTVYKLLELPANNDDLHEAVKIVCIPNALKIVELIISYSAEYGWPDLSTVISTFVKDRNILPILIQHIPMLVDSIFNMAKHYIETREVQNAHDLDKVFNSLVNLIDQLGESPEICDSACKLAYERLKQNFPIFIKESSIYELINIILVKSPNYYDEYNELYPLLVNALNQLDSSSTLIIGDISFLFHNLMIRSPTYMMNYKDQLLQYANFLINLSWDETTFVFLAALIGLLGTQCPLELISVSMNILVDTDENPFLISNADYRSYIEYFCVAIQYFPNFILENYSDFVFECMEEAFNVIDQACILVIIGNMIPPDFRNTILNSIFQISPTDIFDEEDVDDLNFEKEFNCVILEPLPAFSKTHFFSLFIEYIRGLFSTDPNFINMFPPQNHQRIQQYLNYQNY
ncbi:hypothetical protein TRFO_05809 [Tritrichomonas foetus]|uniref:Importin N-terminal domain-containing protein n=1 Tax=Tritrichomonas foetus TaxID=1144522 RepID=A0A1J4K2R6_9EUKA|nr:hypothetical protein TRFO_05809 [Tritrichomonas foetus]|eukprot:OHT05679.1 hypothetical protein TRFO_05809 [Tritrichomonas foetus]